jgi:colicin import membrane protein
LILIKEEIMSENESIESRNQLALVETTLAEYDKIEAGLQDLEKRHANVVFDVHTTAGMKAAIAARAEIREPRIATEKARKAGKAPLLALGKSIDERAKQITLRLTAIEDPVDAQIKAEEERKEAERQARIEAERQRVAKIRERISYISYYATRYAGMPSTKLREARAMVADEPITDDIYAEFGPEAIAVRTATLATIDGMIESALAHEAEQARIIAERAELARLREEEMARQRIAQAQREKEEAEARARRAEEDRIAREQREADEAKAQAERDEADRIARETREAEAEQLAAERAEIARQQAIIDAENRRRAEDEAARKAKAEAAALAKRRAKRPSDSEIIGVLAAHYKVHESKVIEWLLDVDLDAASIALLDEFPGAKAA